MIRRRVGVLAILICTACTPVVRLAAPQGPYFVGSYQEIDVRVRAPIRREDLEFVVATGPAGGRVSATPPPGPAGKGVTLLVGHDPGTYVLEARRATDGRVLATLPFEVSTVTRGDRGPSMWIEGTQSNVGEGSSWGGGTSAPQNFEVLPTSGTQRIAIVLIDTTTQRYTDAEATAIQGRWMDETINGVSVGAIQRSVKAYFEEVSYGAFTVSADTFGPYSLDEAFGHYLNEDGAAQNGYYQASMTAADDDIDYTQFDSVVLVSRSIDGDQDAFAWPRATIGRWSFTTQEGSRSLGVISMPHDWSTRDTRFVHETLSHEIAHNLGLYDLYAPAVDGRNIRNWDMMHRDGAFPHFSASNRMRLGWVDASNVRVLDFSTMPAPVDETLDLHAIQDGSPPAGDFSVVEVRKADGWNYYFEHRRAQPGNIADLEGYAGSVVVGTDVVSPPWTPPSERPDILLLPDEGDGPTLTQGQAYTEQESGSSNPMDFRAEVTGLAANKAELRLQWDVIGRPDPSIRPWPASASRRWQSPDIEVKNEKNAIAPEFFNLPWVGNENTVVGTVRNRGDIDAAQVRVRFYVKDFTVAGGPETLLGTDVQDIPAGGSAEFETTWIPPEDAHFCIVARIELYQTPGTSVLEMTGNNNEAQSNYSSYVSESASPYSRASTSIAVDNPYSERTRVWLVARQDNAWYRTYLSHRWLDLDPGERVFVPLMFEYADALPPGYSAADKRRALEPNLAQVVAYIEDPRTPGAHTAVEYGGLTARVASGLATEMEVRTGGYFASGTVRAVRDDRPALGKVLVGVRRAGETRFGDFQTEPLRSNGSFDVKFAKDWEELQVTYLPAPGFAESERRFKRGG